MTDALASLADCKTWLGLSSAGDDALLAMLIGDVSRAILADIGRAAVLPTTYVDTLDAGGRAVALRQWPVTRVFSCLVGGLPLAAAASAGQPGYVLEPADAAPPGTMQRLVYRGGVFPADALSVSVTYRAGYEVLAESAVVPGVAPYTVAALSPYGAWQVDTGVVGVQAPYTVTAGLYTFDAIDAGAAVALSYGYVPADLARATLEWVADRYAARMRIGQSAKTLGGQETTSFIVKAMPDVVDRLLRPYRRVAA